MSSNLTCAYFSDGWKKTTKQLLLDNPNQLMMLNWWFPKPPLESQSTGRQTTGPQTISWPLTPQNKPPTRRDTNFPCVASDFPKIRGLGAPVGAFLAEKILWRWRRGHPVGTAWLGERKLAFQTGGETWGIAILQWKFDVTSLRGCFSNWILLAGSTGKKHTWGIYHVYTYIYI